MSGKRISFHASAAPEMWGHEGQASERLQPSTRAARLIHQGHLVAVHELRAEMWGHEGQASEPSQLSTSPLVSPHFPTIAAQTHDS